MLKPCFSFITVTFNAEKLLEGTLESVWSQTYPHTECIVVDGASTDGTVDIIKKHQDRIAKWVSEPDNGLYDAMNKGMKMATGDYICFLNAGDKLYDEKTLEQMVASFSTKTELPDILYGHTALVNAEGEFTRMRRLVPPEKLTWKSFKQGMVVCHQAFFVKRELQEPYDLSFRFSADQDWCIRMMKKASDLHNTHQTLIRYLDEGISTKNRKASLKERFHIMVRHYGWVSTLLRHVWFVLRAIIKK